MEIQQIGIWLATQKSIVRALAAELQKVDGYELVLAEIVNECAKLFENGSFVVPFPRWSHAEWAGQWSAVVRRVRLAR
jgi:hypothetical protein